LARALKDSDRQRARRLLEQAQARADEDAWTAESSMMSLAIAWLELDARRAKGVFELLTGRKPPSSELWSRLLLAWVRALADHGDDEGARSASNGLMEGPDLEAARAARSAALARRGRFDLARLLIDDMRSAAWTTALIDVAAAQAEAGDTAGADRMADELPPADRLMALSRIGLAVHERDRPLGAIYFARAARDAGNCSDKSALATAARDAAAGGSFSDAEALALGAKNWDALSFVALVLARAGFVEDAGRVLATVHDERGRPRGRTRTATRSRNSHPQAMSTWRSTSSPRASHHTISIPGASCER